MYQQVAQLMVEYLSIFPGRKVALFFSPARDGIDDPPDHLLHTGLTTRTSQLSTKVLTGDDIGSALRP